MAITNITEKINRLEAAAELDSDIGALSDEQAHFCLRALLAAGHITDDVLRKSIALANTIRMN